MLSRLRGHVSRRIHGRSLASLATQLPAWARASLLDDSHALLEERDALATELMGSQKLGKRAFAQASKRLSHLDTVQSLHKEWTRLKSDVADVQEMEEDPELASLAREELQRVLAELEAVELDLVDKLLPHDESAGKSAMLEVRPGVGGDEAALFANELFHMYERFVAQKGWKWETLSLKVKDNGLREGMAHISCGTGAPASDTLYGILKFESGVHRVQRVPATETQGRIHTSTVAVVVLPEANEQDLDIEEKDLRVDVFRASGAGGQHVNTTESAVRITHLPTNTVVSIQDERSQHQNKRKAMTILRARVAEQRERQRIAQTSKLKNSLVATGDRSEKIRTYNFARDQIVDHRLQVSIFGIQDTLQRPEKIEPQFLAPLYSQELLERVTLAKSVD